MLKLVKIENIKYITHNIAMLIIAWSLYINSHNILLYSILLGYTAHMIIDVFSDSGVFIFKLNIKMLNVKQGSKMEAALHALIWMGITFYFIPMEYWTMLKDKSVEVQKIVMNGDIKP